MVPSDDSQLLRAFRRHESFLRRFIHGFLPNRDDTDEVLQESFLKAFAVELERPIAQPKSFLFQIARNEALTRLRRQSLRIMECIDDAESLMPQDADDPVADLAEHRQLLGLLHEAIAQLPPQCRRAFLLRKVHGLSYKEIARAMGISPSTVEKHLALALRRCDAHLNARSRTHAPQGADDNAAATAQETR
ncbi:MAG TPA: RNA polymerase sigma factor [Chiayiivirga sp.]|nr:RNA polymerase sigma factor [Chiayiivirga sp.]